MVIEAFGKINTLIKLYLMVKNNIFMLDVCNVNTILYLNNLKHLFMHGIQITDDNFLINLANNFKKLILLRVNCGSDISDIGITPLTEIKTLKSLAIITRGNKKITDVPVSEFKNLKKFRCFGNINVSDFAIVKIIKNSPNLVYLDVRFTSVTSEIIREAVALIRSRKDDTVLTIRARRNNFNDELLQRPEYQSPLLKIEYRQE